MPSHATALDLMREPTVCVLIGLALILIFLWRIYERGGAADLIAAARALDLIARAWRRRGIAPAS